MNFLLRGLACLPFLKVKTIEVENLERQKAVNRTCNDRSGDRLNTVHGWLGREYVCGFNRDAEITQPHIYILSINSRAIPERNDKSSMTCVVEAAIDAWIRPIQVDHTDS
jgi:hypothetical protein